MKLRHLIFLVFTYVFVYSGQIYSVNSVDPAAVKNDFTTQTVYGFLDFTTTIGNTVMVFSPQSSPPEGDKTKSPGPAIQTKPVEKKPIPDIQPSKTHKPNNQGETKKQAQKNSKVVVNSVVQQNIINSSEDKQKQVIKSESSHTPIKATTVNPVTSSIVQVQSKEEILGVKNNLAEPEYDYLSKQPTEVIDETYKLINLKPSSKIASKPRSAARREKENPTGLVTKLGGTIVKDGLTTVHETSVIGTYINGKYAQVLQSSSRIIVGTSSNLEGKIRPSNTLRILKTIGPQHGKLKPQLEPTPTSQQEESSLPLEILFSAPAGSSVRTTRRHSTANANRPKYRSKTSEDYDNAEVQARTSTKQRATTARPNYKNRVQNEGKSSTTTQEPQTTRRRTSFRPSNQANSSPRQTNKQKNQQPQQQQQQQTTSTSPLPKLKLPRTQGRWSYKTTPKPRITIRKQVDEDDPRVSTETVITEQASTPGDDKASSTTSVGVITTTTTATTSNGQRKAPEMSLSNEELDPSESEDVPHVSVQDQIHADQTLPIETLNVEISTAANLNDVYFEIATIKSPYTFQVGTLRNTRYITVTSTMKKSFAVPEPTSTLPMTEPLTENILANTGAAYETSLPLDSSVATLPAISLDAGQVTPPLETLTETFSTTQTLLKTHLLPVIHDGNTTKLTLVQTYNIARSVTATKTLPPMEIYQFIPSKTLNEFNSKLEEAGSELHLELDFGDEDRDDEDIPKRIVAPSSDVYSELDLFRSVTPTKVKSDTPSTSSAEPQLSLEQAQQLALLKYFGQPQQQVITTSRPVVVLETVYESHVIPIVNNGNTHYSTLSRPVATVPRTSYEYSTSTIPPVLPPPIPQVPLFPQQQPQFTVTSAPLVTQTLVTVSDSRVLKLTFGAKTAYTTLFSTKVVPTELTTYVTSTIPLQPTIPAFPGYYPPPVGYPPFPYVG
ncbi:mucin-17 isoform X2 [Vespa velutina]|uniref:mucin-17 isoform X2 n=1 Tax=Vespa velutina TaxID=202808 RepID=UPI001FB29F9D|nr:mucin-17 isoform X2 [Vespa velutina]